MERAKVIAAIEKLKGGAHTQQIKDVGEQLQAYSDQRLSVWHEGWARKVLLAVMFGPIVLVLGVVRSWRHSSIPGFSLWWILVWFVTTIVCSWVYMRLRPKAGSKRFGLSKKCVECRYSLAGLGSSIGEELWVGPKVCPECGQDYPALWK